MSHTGDFWGQQPKAAVTLLQQNFGDGAVDETLASSFGERKTEICMKFINIHWIKNGD